MPTDPSDSIYDAIMHAYHGYATDTVRRIRLTPEDSTAGNDFLATLPNGTEVVVTADTGDGSFTIDLSGEPDDSRELIITALPPRTPSLERSYRCPACSTYAAHLTKKSSITATGLYCACITCGHGWIHRP